MNIILNEDSTSWLLVSFYDKDDVLTTPSAAYYWINDFETGNVIKAETAISPLSTTAEVEITASDNAIIDNTLPMEKKVVTVRAEYGAGKQVIDEFFYFVKNLRHES